ncbi:MAG: DNA-protecting protein DprA [Ruminococcaceae bacterium]|nr:DNA-protecting protein DprA [Oscillospiraceae bacterium]
MSLRHWIWLTLELPRAARSVALLDALESPERIYTADRETLAATGILKKEEIDRLLAHRSLEQAQAVLLRTAELGIQVITLRDAAYPDRLRNIDNPPPVLYCKGTLPTVDDHVCMAVVGTRRASVAACRTAERFAYNLARSGIIVVSGMAAGIDSQGHLGALRAGMPTIAVFGCGLDICFPAENRQLMENIIENGCILSEYPPGTPTSKYTFPERNRIISGLSMGVLVAAAPKRSGSLITARHALEQGRDVFIIPGDINDPEYAGGNEYIKEGAAMVTQPEDILREYLERWPELIKPPAPKAAPAPLFPEEAPVGERVKQAPRQETEKKPRWTPSWINPAKLGMKKESPVQPPVAQTPATPEPVPETTQPKNAAAADYAALTPNDQRIIEAIQNGANHLDRIIEATGLSTDIVVSQLVILEVEGIVEKDASDHVSIAGK